MITSPKKNMDSDKSDTSDTCNNVIKKPEAMYPPLVPEMQYPLPSAFPAHNWQATNGIPIFYPYANIFNDFSPVSIGNSIGNRNTLMPGWNNGMARGTTNSRTLPIAATRNRVPPPAISLQQAAFPQMKKSPLNETEDIASMKPTVIDSCPSDENDHDENDGRRLYIDTVLDSDVLCGRGGKSNHHLGNKYYRDIVSNMKMKYKDTKGKKAKTEMSRAVVHHIYSYGGRFVKKEETTGRYYALSQKEARKKTSQALREAKDIKCSMYSEGN